MRGSNPQSVAQSVACVKKKKLLQLQCGSVRNACYFVLTLK